MGSIANLRASLQWDIDDFQRGTAAIENAFKSVINLAGKVADAVANAGKRMTVGMTLPLSGLAVLVTKAASDAAELQSAFDYTFGAMSASMNKWAEQSGDAMGRATGEMQQGALAFGQLFKAAAPTEAAAARLSQRFTELAQDASSFFNTDFATAMGKIRSGLTGEAEPLRDFGVFISEAAVEAKALELGLVQTGQELTEYGKVMARAALIAEGLSAASGDVERTSDSLANRLRKIKGDMQELAVEFGRLLEPYAQKLASVAEAVIGWFKALPEGVKQAMVGFAAFLAVLGPLSIALSAIAVMVLPLLLVRLGPVFAVISAIVNPIGTLIVMAKNLAVSFGGVSAILGRLAPLFLRLTGPVGIAISLLSLFGSDIVEGFRKFFDVVSKAIGPAVHELFARAANLVDQLKAAFDQLAQSPVGDFLEFAGELIGWLIVKFFELAGYVTGEFLKSILDAMNAIMEFISGTVDVVAKLLTGDWAGAWDAAVQVVGRAAIRIGQWISRVFPQLGHLLMLVGMLTGAKLTTPAAPAAPSSSSDKGEDGAGIGPVTGGDYALPSDPKKDRAGRTRTRTGPTAAELAARRDAIRLEQEMDLAREKGDEDALRALERQRDLKDRIEQYDRAGLNAADARLAAERDMLELDEARAAARVKALEDIEVEIERQVAALNNDFARLRYLDEEEDRKERINRLRREGFDLATAERIAQRQIAAIEEARADNVARRLADQQQAHDMELARLRGDSDAALRAMDEQARIRDRSRELESDYDMDPRDAMAQALRESMDREQAHMQGTFRDAFRNGLRAALDGDLKGFFEGWMKDRTFKALSNVLDRLADQLANLASGQGGGGGLLGTIGSAIGSLFGGAKSASAGNGSNMQGPILNTRAGAASSGKPGFATGGSFQIKGHPGIDTNLLSLNDNPIARVSTGEIVNVERGGGSSGGMTVRQEFHFSGAVDVATKAEVIRMGEAAYNGALQAMAEAKRRAA